MKLTKKQLRTLISEAFVGQQGAPPIKIRTDTSGGSTYPYALPVRKVSPELTPESLDAILGRFISDYDAIKQLPQKPAAPGQRSAQYQAILDRGYNMKAEDFLNYGGRLKKLAMSDDEATQRQALNIGSTLGFFSMGIEDLETGEYIGLTGDDLVAAEEAGQQLLNDPKFADIGDVAVREDEDKEADIQHITYLLNSDNPKDRSLGVSKLSGALTNDNFKERFRRKIDNAFKKALPHIKESILVEVAYQIRTYGGDPRRKDLYDGMDIDEFAEENDHAIMGTLGGDFTAFQEIDVVFDAGFNETNELINYFHELSIKSIKRAIEELIGAGLLKRGAQPNSFIMTMNDYYDRINRRRGGGDAYVPSPNLPAITREGKIKITRSQLRRLISEMARTPMEDPKKDLDKIIDPKQMEKLPALYDTGEEDLINFADFEAEALGAPDYLSKRVARYEVEPIMNEFEFAEPYLSTDQLKHLMQAQGKELKLGHDQFRNVGFNPARSEIPLDFIIEPLELHDMIVQVAGKRPAPGAPFGGKVYQDYGRKVGTDTHLQNYANYYQTLMKFFEAIIKISEKTFIHEYQIASYGMGDYGHGSGGTRRLNSPFDKLRDSGKLSVGFPYY